VWVYLTIKATSVDSSVDPRSSKWAVVLAARPLNISNRCSPISHNLLPPRRDFQQGLRLQLDFNSINSINMGDPHPHLWDSSSRCILVGLQDSLLHYQQDLEGHPNCKDFQDKYLQVPLQGLLDSHPQVRRLVLGDMVEVGKCCINSVVLSFYIYMYLEFFTSLDIYLWAFVFHFSFPFCHHNVLRIMNPVIS
jgi:hypothetical protein